MLLNFRDRTPKCTNRSAIELLNIPYLYYGYLLLADKSGSLTNGFRILKIIKVFLFLQGTLLLADGSGSSRSSPEPSCISAEDEDELATETTDTSVDVSDDSADVVPTTATVCFSTDVVSCCQTF
jgi:hypothetical protein